MHPTLDQDHVLLALVVGTLIALWPAGSLVPLAEAGLYLAPFALFVVSLTVADALEARYSD
jgi:hypothetical protein